MFALSFKDLNSPDDTRASKFYRSFDTQPALLSKQAGRCDSYSWRSHGLDVLDALPPEDHVLRQAISYTSPCAKLCHAYRCRDVQSFLISMLGPKRELLGVALVEEAVLFKIIVHPGRCFIVYPYGKRVDVTKFSTRAGSWA